MGYFDYTKSTTRSNQLLQQMLADQVQEAKEAAMLSSRKKVDDEAQRKKMTKTKYFSFNSQKSSREEDEISVRWRKDRL